MAMKKLFMISFTVTSIFFSLLYLLFAPTTVTMTSMIETLKTPILPFRPQQNLNSTLPRFAYLISASKGDTQKVKRLLRSIYHRSNHYLIHLDLEAPKSEHQEMARFVAGDPLFRPEGNVMLVGKPNLVTYRGPTMLATTLHAMALLLRCCRWDWFINLSASDYPLVTQDDLIYAFSELPNDLNFIQHTSRLGWKMNKRGKPVIIDPGLYSLNKSEIWWVIKQRSLPTAFKLFTGSAWTFLSRPFSEYCVIGYDNLPRTLLLYYTNFVSSPEGYFQTLICNSDEFRNTTVNHDLHYISWDNPPKQHPRNLGPKDFRKMVMSNRPFARKFKRNDPVLDKIDKELLKRKPRSKDGGAELRPGPGARRLRSLLMRLMLRKNFDKRQCR
ncbi:PREDICTED: beta-glucuronosyltransferase GlcAT14A isoform X1 [Tarenaya hassleriana]|uniref:beta-glucuronosyltransferase GlcAT14A isoform X1 n=1 Tax=Tarenaya hassleriana TaxID=28532 RepID=UPI00053C5752|nr:PREDICTED: beta-glucuronosyltransferase GlcAT14A isoform X1 [Tarenaya hassleriana]